ncbi:MAG: hypothetical protein SFU98_12565 [Leptospiraceae bacterium]|nr:hypothetical protein [Leptospiraceae bacterium]
MKNKVETNISKDVILIPKFKRIEGSDSSYQWDISNSCPKDFSIKEIYFDEYKPTKIHCTKN